MRHLSLSPFNIDFNIDLTCKPVYIYSFKVPFGGITTAKTGGRGEVTAITLEKGGGVGRLVE